MSEVSVASVINDVEHRYSLEVAGHQL